jgi:hypothetical protein
MPFQMIDGGKGSTEALPIIISGKLEERNTRVFV